MSQSRFLVICLLTLTGAFADGFAASHAIPVAHAQTLPAPGIQATSFTVVDAQGRVQATLRSGAGGAELVLDGAPGRSRVEINPGGIVIRDVNGRVVWSSHGRVMPATAE